MSSWKFALFMLVALVPSWALHEYAHAFVAVRMGDPTPRQHGRLTLNPKAHADPFGSLLLPALLLLLVGAGGPRLVFAYGKPLPLNPFAQRSTNRATAWIALAGPLCNLVLAAAAAIGLRTVQGGDVAALLLAALTVNVTLFVFNLMPIPGLDGAKLLGLALSGRAQEVYRNLDQYLPLFLILVFFILSAPVLSIVHILGNALCQGLAGGPCF